MGLDKAPPIPEPPPDAAFLKELIDASPATISLIDTERWEVKYQNATGEKQLGKVVGQCCHQSVLKLEQRCQFCKAPEALKTGVMTSAEVRLPSGQWLLMQWSPVRAGDSMLAMETLVDLTAQKHREEEYRQLKELFERLATIDPLTELLNRRGWFTLAERLSRRAAQSHERVGIVIADVDLFKQVNDHYGHQAGDQVLRHVANVLQHQFRAGDLVGRWGGEEFIVLLPSDEPELLETIAERVRKAVESTPYVAGDLHLPVTVSLGGTSFIPQTGDLKELELMIADADRKMYLAKRQGRNQVVL